MSDAEFVIVGGGVYGAAIAYELSSRGSSVILLEAAGHLASYASGGIGKRGVRANHRNSRELPLARESLELWPALSGALGADTGFEALGGILLVSGSPDGHLAARAQAEAIQALQVTCGITTELLGRGDLEPVEPGLGVDEIAGLYCPAEGIASQQGTVLAFANAAKRQGARIRVLSDVELVGAGPRPFVRLQDGSLIEARRTVVLATGYGTNPLLLRSGLPVLPMWVTAPQMLLFKAPGGYQPRHLLNHMQKPTSLKPLRDGVTMISGGPRGFWKPDGATGAPNQEEVPKSIAIASSVLPGLAGGELVVADANSPETYTPDLLPYIDFVTEDGSIFVAAGWSGHGFAISPATSRHIADWLATTRRPEILSPFTLPRC